MQNILKLAINFFILFLLCVPSVSQAEKNAYFDITKPKIYKHEQVSEICIDGKFLSLTYNYPKRLLSIISRPSGKRIYYEKLPKGYNPEYVMGGDGDVIRFLPMKFQPYLIKGKVLYFSSKRTISGNGMGQCGAGLETFLNVFDIKSKTPRRVSSILISSCAENIELSTSNPAIDDADYTDLSVSYGRLKIVFTSYKGKHFEKIEDAPTAILSDDYKSLEFVSDGKSAGHAKLLRCEANHPCPREGYWFTPAKADSRRHFKQGETMPDLGSAWGLTIWQWDENQD